MDRKPHRPLEGNFELRNRSQTLNCSIHVAGIAQVCQTTGQLHLQRKGNILSLILLNKMSFVTISNPSQLLNKLD